MSGLQKVPESLYIPPRGFIYGLELEYVSAGDIKVNIGAAIDDTNSYLMDFPAAMTKAVLASDGDWSAGTGNSGVDDSGTHTTAAGDSLHIFLIGDSTGTNAPDILVSNSYGSPSLPTGYDIKRWVGAVVFRTTDTIADFYCSKGERRIVYKSPALDDSQTGQNFSSTAGTLTPAVPSGIRVTVDLNLSFVPDTPVADQWYVFNTDIADQAPGLTTAPGYTARLTNNVSVHIGPSRFTFETSTDGVLKVRTTVSANTSYYLTTLAYEYER